MPAEARIVAYLIFVVSLFLFPSPSFYLLLLLILAVCLSRLPLRTLTSGWMPISMFLFFTFLSNVFNQHGRIMYAAGPLLITQEGLHLAAIRTLRVLLMIGGVKVLMASTPTNEIIRALSRLLTPFERVGVPVKDFFHIMGLTMQCFPVLKHAIVKHYREDIQKGAHRGIMEKARLIALFLLPLFVESIRSPELFFRDSKTS